MLIPFVGSQVTKTCQSGTSYFESIDECVPNAIASLSMFLSAFTRVVTCSGGIVRTQDDLERLRFCNVVQGSLVVHVEDLAADFTALYDISSIQGTS